jgi:hypothetical protein
MPEPCQQNKTLKSLIFVDYLSPYSTPLIANFALGREFFT